MFSIRDMVLGRSGMDAALVVRDERSLCRCRLIQRQQAAFNQLTIIGIQLETFFGRHEHFFKKIVINVRSERRKPHHFAFVAVFRITDKLTNRRVKRSQRMRHENSLQRANLAAFALGKHARNKIARPVNGNRRAFFPAGSQIRACRMRQVMLDEMPLERAVVPDMAKAFAQVVRRAAGEKALNRGGGELVLVLPAVVEGGREPARRRRQGRRR